LHVRGGIFEEVLVTLTKGIKSLLTTTRSGETVLRTFALTGKEKLTLAAIRRQRVTFLYTEAEELGLALQVAQVLLTDISKSIFGIYEMVAHVHITIMFYH
jgi:hypothetical protein